jgi:3-oxoadipate CoA-transferase beta subunit
MTVDTREDIKLSNAQIAWRAAQDIADGAYVNLGIGFPEMVARYQPEGREAIFHTENGILDFGEAPPEGEEDWDLINAGKKAVTLKPGAAFFHHADSFAMVRGGHLDVAILGAYQVAQNGDLANWRVGAKGGPWRQAGGGHHRTCHQEGRAEAGRKMRLSADRRRLHHAHLYEPCSG